jgi:hypothetical protein
MEAWPRRRGTRQINGVYVITFAAPHDMGIRCHGPSLDIDGDTSLMISESGHDLTPAHHVRPVMT